MIIYHPATDIYHCWMRIASLLCAHRNNGIEFDRLRIIDFYQCFPHELQTCKLPSQHSSHIRKLVRNIPITYENPYSIRQAFHQMKMIQLHVAMDMVAKSIIQRDAYREGLILCTETPMQSLLDAVAENWEARKTEWYALVVQVLFDLPLNGKDGLKARSSLLEYRYDA